MPAYKKFNIQARKFSNQKDNDRYLKIENDPATFVRLLCALSRTQMNMNGENIELSLREVEEDYYSNVYNFFINRGKIDYIQLSGDLNFSSAYVEVQKNPKRRWEHFENLYTSLPDRFPICVDYIM